MCFTTSSYKKQNRNETILKTIELKDELQISFMAYMIIYNLAFD